MSNQTAYERLSKITEGRDPTIPISLSTFCQLFDLRLSKEGREHTLNWMEEYLKEYPNGIDTEIGSKND